MITIVLYIPGKADPDQDVGPIVAVSDSKMEETQDAADEGSANPKIIQVGSPHPSEDQESIQALVEYRPTKKAKAATGEE